MDEKEWCDKNRGGLCGMDTCRNKSSVAVLYKYLQSFMGDAREREIHYCRMHKDFLELHPQYFHVVRKTCVYQRKKELAT
jgi:hypothetical protein